MRLAASFKSNKFRNFMHRDCQRKRDTLPIRAVGLSRSGSLASALGAIGDDLGGVWRRHYLGHIHRFIQKHSHPFQYSDNPPWTEHIFCTTAHLEMKHAHNLDLAYLFSIPLFIAIFVNHFHNPPPVYREAIQASIGSCMSTHSLGNRININDFALRFSIPRPVLCPPSLSILKHAGPQWSEQTDG